MKDPDQAPICSKHYLNCLCGTNCPPTALRLQRQSTLEAPPLPIKLAHAYPRQGPQVNRWVACVDACIRSYTGSAYVGIHEFLVLSDIVSLASQHIFTKKTACSMVKWRGYHERKLGGEASELPPATYPIWPRGKR
jgi:hypothetical protein